MDKKTQQRRFEMMNLMYRQNGNVHNSSYRQKARKFEDSWQEEWDRLQEDTYIEEDDNYKEGDDYEPENWDGR